MAWGGGGGIRDLEKIPKWRRERDDSETKDRFCQGERETYGEEHKERERIREKERTEVIVEVEN